MQYRKLSRSKIVFLCSIPFLLAALIVSGNPDVSYQPEKDYTRYVNFDTNWSIEDRSESLRKAKNTEGLPSNGIKVEVTDYPNERPTKQELEKAYELYNQSFRSA